MTTTWDHLPTVIAANNIPGPGQGHWTYRDYVSLPDDGKRYEIVDGVLFMAPSPDRWHQKAAGRLFSYLLRYVEDAGVGEVYTAPFDVVLEPRVVVQPDVIVVLAANLNKITDKRIIGAPDLVVEVASPGPTGFDRREKQNAYARAGVPEYWIVDPAAHTIEVLVLEGAAYYSYGVFQGQTTLPSKIVP
jgi:Uma2 family endonuclease